MVKYYFGRDKPKIFIKRDYRILIRKHKTTNTANFSLYNCDLKLNEILELFKNIIVINKDIFFKQDFLFLDSWGEKKGFASHYIIIQEMYKKTNRSVTLSVYLHNFDFDEIKNVLVNIFCNIRFGGKNDK